MLWVGLRVKDISQDVIKGESIILRLFLCLVLPCCSRNPSSYGYYRKVPSDARFSLIQTA